MTDIAEVIKRLKNVFGNDVEFRQREDNNYDLIVLGNTIQESCFKEDGNDIEMFNHKINVINNYLDSNGISYLCRSLRWQTASHSCNLVGDRITVEYYDKNLQAQKVGPARFEVYLNGGLIERCFGITRTLEWFRQQLGVAPIEDIPVVEEVVLVAEEVSVYTITPEFLDAIQLNISEALIEKFEGTANTEEQTQLILEELNRMCIAPTVLNYEVIDTVAEVESWADVYPDTLIRQYAKLVHFFVRKFNLKTVYVQYRWWHSLFLYNKIPPYNSRFRVPRIYHNVGVYLKTNNQKVFTSIDVDMESK